jgi:hypothetical protein
MSSSATSTRVTPTARQAAPMAPVDQAAGLRQMFATRALRFIPVVANGSAGYGGLVLERLCTAYATLGLHTLVVDAGDQARPPCELAEFDLAEGIEPLSRQVSYMAARGLPLRHVDARGNCDSLLDALAEASPQSDVVLVPPNWSACLGTAPVATTCALWSTPTTRPRASRRPTSASRSSASAPAGWPMT